MSPHPRMRTTARLLTAAAAVTALAFIGAAPAEAAPTNTPTLGGAMLDGSWIGYGAAPDDGVDVGSTRFQEDLWDLKTPTAAGRFTLSIYDNNSCDGPAAWSVNDTVQPDYRGWWTGSYRPPLQPGRYWFRSSFAGDNVNAPVTVECGTRVIPGTGGAVTPWNGIKVDVPHVEVDKYSATSPYSVDANAAVHSKGWMGYSGGGVNPEYSVTTGLFTTKDCSGDPADSTTTVIDANSGVAGHQPGAADYGLPRHAGTLYEKALAVKQTGPGPASNLYQGDWDVSLVPNSTPCAPLVSVYRQTPKVNVSAANAPLGGTLVTTVSVVSPYNLATATGQVTVTATSGNGSSHTETLTLDKDGKAQSSWSPNAISGYTWHATYNGSSDLLAATGDGFSAMTQTPTIAVAATDTNASDPSTVTISGNGFANGLRSGTVTINEYESGDCTGPVETYTEVPAYQGNQGQVTPDRTGTHSVRGVYTGTQSDDPITSACATFAVAHRSLTPYQRATLGSSGSAIHAELELVDRGDSHLTAAHLPTGRVQFRLYDNAEMSGTPLFTTSAPLTGTTDPADSTRYASALAVSSDYTPAHAGVYYWAESWDGDDRYLPVDGLPTTAVDYDPAPTANDDTIVVPAGWVSDAVNVLANDTFTGDATVDYLEQPQHGTFDMSAVPGTFDYLPEPGYSGTDTVRYRLTDDTGQSSTATITITSTDTPAARDDSGTTPENKAVTVAVLANDTYHTAPAKLVIPTAAAQGTVTVTDDNKVTYTPNPGFSGTDSFSYGWDTDPDGKLISADVTVDVTPAPADPAPPTTDPTPAPPTTDPTPAPPTTDPTPAPPTTDPTPAPPTPKPTPPATDPTPTHKHHPAPPRHRSTHKPSGPVIPTGIDTGNGGQAAALRREQQDELMIYLAALLALTFTGAATVQRHRRRR